MTVSGEEVTGFVVAIPVETLRALPHLPMYRDVTVETLAAEPSLAEIQNAKNIS